MKIIITAISRKTTEPQLKELFAEYGEVTACNLVLDKDTNKSKGFGFVEMPNESNAKFAIKKLNNRTVNDRRIRVKIARNK